MKKLLSSFLIYLFLCVSPASAFMNYPSRYFSGVAIKNVKNYGTYRAWSDGSLASTCDQYKNPTSGAYVGDTGDGVYRINPGGTARNVYCLMTYDTDGWILGYQRVTTGVLAANDYNAAGNFVSIEALRDYTYSKQRVLKWTNGYETIENKCALYFTGSGYQVWSPPAGKTLAAHASIYNSLREYRSIGFKSAAEQSPTPWYINGTNLTWEIGPYGSSGNRTLQHSNLQVLAHVAWPGIMAGDTVTTNCPAHQLKLYFK